MAQNKKTEGNKEENNGIVEEAEKKSEESKESKEMQEAEKAESMKEAEKKAEEKLAGEEIKQVRICPKCGSTNVSWDYGAPWVVKYGVNRDSCNDCGLKGNFPTVDDDKSETLKNMLNKEENKGEVENK